MTVLAPVPAHSRRCAGRTRGRALAILAVAGAMAVTLPSSPAADGRATAVLAEHVLAPLNLSAFGPTEAAVATAQANGLAVVDRPAIGSGLQRLAGNHFLSISDRGPTFTRTTPTPGRVFPLPNYTPSLVFFQVFDGQIIPQAHIPLIVDDSGTHATGVSNSANDDSVPFASPTATTQLPFNPNGLDIEDVHTLPEGNFILVDEYSPSIVVVSETGKVLKRYTPQGKTLAGAAYPVSDSLPAILAQRRSNRG